MLKKILHITGWLLVLAYMVVALGFTNKKSEEIKCHNIKVIIKNPDHSFIEKEDISLLFDVHKLQPKGMYLSTINLEKLESLLYTHPAVKKAEVYKSIDGILTVDLCQRNPVMRIMNKKTEGYYIDEDGKIMPLPDKYTAHVLIVNGEINESYNKNKKKNLSIPSNGDMSRNSLLNDLFTLGMYIWKNDFWKAQIEQVYINNHQEIELTPRLGAHTIIFGTAENIEEKFFKLEALYKYGLNNVGWKKYKNINIKFKNQVICTKIE